MVQTRTKPNNPLSPSEVAVELQADDYLKVTRLGYAAAEKAHPKAKMNQIRKLERLMESRDKSCARCPTGIDTFARLSCELVMFLVL